MAETGGVGRNMDDKKIEQGADSGQVTAVKEQDAREGSGSEKQNPPRMGQPERKKDQDDALGRFFSVGQNLREFDALSPEDKAKIKAEREALTPDDREKLSREKKERMAISETWEKLSGLRIGKKKINGEPDMVSAVDIFLNANGGLKKMLAGEKLTVEEEDGLDQLGSALSLESMAEKNGKEIPGNELKEILEKVLGSEDQEKGADLTKWLIDGFKAKREGRPEDVDISRFVDILKEKPEGLEDLISALETGKPIPAGEELPGPAPLREGESLQRGVSGEGNGGEGQASEGGGGPENRGKNKSSEAKLRALVEWLKNCTPPDLKRLAKNFGILALVLLAAYVGIGMRGYSELIEKAYTGH